MRSPLGQLVGIALDDLPPDMTEAAALGCLPLLVAFYLTAATFAATAAQPKLGERAAHVLSLSGAALSDPLRGFPACAVVGVPQGQTIRQAANAGGVDPQRRPLACEHPRSLFQRIAVLPN